MERKDLERGSGDGITQFAQYIPQIVSFAENKIGFRVERRADLAEPAVAASTLEAVLVPVHVQRFQEISG